ncbi:MAG: hypothetical protein E7523_10445 [Ruminococcaceae bacterium]|nr:hypothetical protein [Oscillospiraceae bacterium]
MRLTNLLFFSLVGTLSSSVGSSDKRPHAFSLAVCCRRGRFSSSTKPVK